MTDIIKGIRGVGSGADRWPNIGIPTNPGGRPDIEYLEEIMIGISSLPWEACHGGHCPCATVWSIPDDNMVHIPFVETEDMGEPKPSRDMEKANARFIAADATITPYLIAYIRRMEGFVEYVDTMLKVGTDRDHITVLVSRFIEENWESIDNA